LVINVQSIHDARSEKHQVIDHYVYKGYIIQNIYVKNVEFSSILKTSFCRKRDFFGIRLRYKYNERRSGALELYFLFVWLFL